MSYTYNSFISYDEPGVSYNGDGQSVSKTPLPVAFAERLRRSNVTPVFLVTVQVGMHARGWTYVPLGPETHYVNVPADTPLISEVAINDGFTLEQVFDSSDVGSSNYGRFWHDPVLDRLYVNPPEGRTVFDDTYTIRINQRYSNIAKELRGFYWSPRLKQAPNLSIRIEEVFGGVGQLGGGRMSLSNADGHFDGLQQLDWDNGSVTVEMGVDLPEGDGGAMDEADYIKLGTWRVQSWDIREDDFILQLAELKTKLAERIPFETYSRDDYPALGNPDVGKVIPRAYGRIFGVKPTILDREAKRFKVAGHPIRSFDGVRVRKSIEEILTETVPAADWSEDGIDRHTTTVLEQVVNVQFDGTDLAEQNSAQAVRSNVGSWYYESEVLYVRPPSGQTVSSGTWTVFKRQTLSAWVPVDFETKDLIEAEFTLGDAWDRSAEVSVDFSGRVLPNGQLMGNGADIAADLIDYVGEIVLDAATFDAARRALHIGYDRFGFEVNHLTPSIYIDKATEALKVFSELNSIIGSYLFVGLAGDWRFNVFQGERGVLFDPTPGAGLRYFTGDDIIDGTFSKLTETDEMHAKVKVEFGRRDAEEWAEAVERTRLVNRYRHNLSESLIAEREVGLSKLNNARYWAERFLTTEAVPRVAYSWRVPWPAYFLAPGDKVHLIYERFDVDAILEVLEVGYDLVRGDLRITAGNLRGWGDTFGFWLSDTGTVDLDVEPDLLFEAEGLNYLEGDPVQQWLDTSGNDGHLTQASSGAKPTYRANQINGFGVIEFGFNSTNNLARHLKFPASVFDSWEEAEMFLVIKADNDPAPGAEDRNTPHWLSSVTLGQQQRYPDAAGDIQEAFFSTTLHNAGNPAPDLTGWRIYNVRSKNGLFEVDIDNANLFTTATNTFAIPNLTAQLGAATVSRWFAGKVASLIMFRRFLTASERTSVNQYLSDRYAFGLLASGGPPPSWDSNWSDARVRLEKQNAGYWHGTDDLAHSSDPRSYFASRWW